MGKPLPPGARVECRNAQWVVHNCVYANELRSYLVEVEGMEGLIEGIRASFLDAIDAIKVIDPLDVKFVPDKSPQFRDTKLQIDLWMRKAVPTGKELTIGHNAAINPEEFQHVAACKALDETKHLRARILMADAVGLGKTIQVGILLADLIKRQRGKRILVVCLKSMAQQFQKEIWSRFAIPLKMLDAKEVDRVYHEIPGNMNPLDRFDRAIISMDTLKGKLKRYLNDTHYDVIVIDECHNVARRSGQGSGRARLARQLSSICDNLILTSATPHDGKKESYSSLLELLDPTLVIDPEDISKDDLAKIAVRRFHKDVQLQQKIPERCAHREYVSITALEEKLLTAIKQANFKRLSKSTRDALFRTTLAKALFSSPEAFRSVLSNREKKIKDSNELKTVRQLLTHSEQLAMQATPKYQKLNVVLDKIGKKERVVIFTESKATQQALKDNLSCDRKLRVGKKDQEFEAQAELVIMHAGLAEETQQKIVEAFASNNSKIKILIATDVASEGINLHHFCNHLIHYDISWSLITLEQRNGRIDRYGQTKQPHIYYIVGETSNEALTKFNEHYVVDKLATKLEAVKQQLGDAGLAMGLFNSEKEEEKVAEQIEQEKDPYDILLNDFDKQEVFGTITDKSDQPAYQDSEKLLSDEDFLKKSMNLLGIEHTENENIFTITNTSNKKHEHTLKYPFQNLNKELKGANNLQLTCNTERVNSAITQARKDTNSWPELSYWWELNPLWQTLVRRVDSQLNGKEVRVATLATNKSQRVPYYVLHGSVTNRLGQPQISELQLACVVRGKIKLFPASEGLKQLGFTRRDIPNRAADINGITKQLHTYLTKIVHCYAVKLQERGDALQQTQSQQLHSYQDEIDTWQKKKTAWLERKYKSRPRSKEEEKKLVAQTHANYQNLIEKKFNLQSKFPYVKLLAVIIAAEVLNDG